MLSIAGRLNHAARQEFCGRDGERQYRAPANCRQHKTGRWDTGRTRAERRQDTCRTQCRTQAGHMQNAGMAGHRQGTGRT